MTNTMQAVWISTYGGPEVLEIRTVGKPLINDEQVLVRVRASSLNRADLLQRQGKYPAPQGVVQNIPGLEFAGEVAELGPGAMYWEKSDRVFGLTPGGAHAERRSRSGRRRHHRAALCFLERHLQGDGDP